MLERAVEQRLLRTVRRLGGVALKLYQRSEPDRLVLLPHGVVLFVETKRPGKHPRPDQRHAHARLRRLGFCVLVCDGTNWPQILYMIRLRCKVGVHSHLT